MYDIGTGHPYSFRDIAEIVSKKYGARIEEIDFPEHLQGKYQYYTCADIKKLISIIGDYKFKTIKEYIYND